MCNPGQQSFVTWIQSKIFVIYILYIESVPYLAIYTSPDKNNECALCAYTVLERKLLRVFKDFYMYQNVISGFEWYFVLSYVSNVKEVCIDQKSEQCFSYTL